MAWWYIFKKEILNGLRFLDGRLCEDGIFTSELLQYVDKGWFYENKVYGYYHNPESILRTKNIPRLTKTNDDLFFVVWAFDRVINQLPKKKPYYTAVFNRLRHRQESYLFYAFVRFLKLKRSNTILKSRFKELAASRYAVYPIKEFDGYGYKRNQLLIRVFNSKHLFLIVNSMNRLFN